MSIFSGIINEYPSISIDNFNPLVSIYFLSHLHLDHIKGIDNFLSTDNTMIYASIMTCQLIRGRYSEFKDIISNLVELQLKTSYNIVTNSDSFTIILIPSGHCLGSVMFLIEGSKGIVLYTGDFRFPIGYASDMLTEYKLKKLDTIYLDTTFMNKSCVFIPCREESLSAILNIIEEFLLKSSENMIFIDYKVRYTIEILYHLIFLKFNIKVHVDWKYFAQLSELDETMTHCMDPYNINSQIHACFLGDSDKSANFCKNKIASNKKNGKLLTIIPSTIWWSERNLLGNKFIHWINKYTVRVCFSHHSSYSEIIDFISNIPSNSIIDCVSRSTFTLTKIKTLFES